MAAEKLYAALAAAKTLPEALALTYRAMIEEKSRDWHLLRLYVTGALSKNLVTPKNTRGRQPVRKASMASEFLDVEQRVKVPTRGSFIGRRRPLQNCLRSLQDPDGLGVLLHGMGGLGKSSLAARLCDRLPNFERVVWFGPLDEAGLVNRLAEHVKDRDLRQRLQDPNEDLKYRLRELFEAETGLTFLLVLDDFEANLEEESLRLKAAVAKVLGALLWAMESAQMGHKVLITCRYDFDFTGLATVYKQPLDGLKGADLKKKCQQLGAFGQKSMIEEDLRKRAITLADGNPSLLEWLDDKVLQEPSDLSVLALLEALEGERQVELREKVLAQALLAQMDEPMRAMLTRARVYELPVPKAAIVAVCEGMADVDSLTGKAVALGLLEQSPDKSLRVPRVLLLDLIADEELAAQAAKSLYQIWWEGAESSSEVQVLEIYRLAILGETEEIAGNITMALASQWMKLSRFREVAQRCQETLKVVSDHRIFHSLAQAQRQIGEVVSAASNYRKALEVCPENDEGEKAAIFHNSAGLKAQQGDVEGAITLYQQSLAMTEQIGNAQGKAANLHQLAGLKAQQGDVEGAITLYQQSLAMTEQIGDALGKAATLHQLAILEAQQGDVEGAITLCQQSLAMTEQIGNAQGKAANLHQLAGLKAQQGDVEGAITLYQQSLAMTEQIGDALGKAATLHQLAILEAQQGDVEGAITLYQQSLAIKEQIGDALGKAATLHQLAILEAQQGDVEGAIALYRQSLEIQEQIGNAQGKAVTLGTLGQLLADQKGDVETAVPYLQESITILQKIGSPSAQIVQDILDRIKR